MELLLTPSIFGILGPQRSMSRIPTLIEFEIIIVDSEGVEEIKKTKEINGRETDPEAPTIQGECCLHGHGALANASLARQHEHNVLDLLEAAG